MTPIIDSEEALPPQTKNRLKTTIKIICFGSILAIAALFVCNYVFYYYLHYSEGGFTDPTHGSPNFWVMRLWLLMHITGGTVAILTGPWQFWTGFRAKYARIHRWMGRMFLAGVAVGATGAFRMVVVTTGGWAFGVALFGLATAWVTTTGMAYYAILRGQVAIHREWMVRAYVVTFGFVTFRVLLDYGPTSRLQPEGDRSVMAAWACWAFPLLVTEVILQLRRMRRGVSTEAV